jgi:5-methyltetrahydropteroyltriglutamate--homocysteine methyltransferase
MIDGVDGVKIALHLCRRAGARVRGEIKHAGGYGPILQQLNRLNVHHLTMEFTTPAAGDLAIFRDLRDDLEIGLGCVSCEPGNISTTKDIVDRVNQVCEYIDPSRITLNPDCGFAPGSAANVSLDEVYIKLKNEAEAATRLRQHYG